MDIGGFEPFWGEWLTDGLIGTGRYSRVYRARRECFGELYYCALKHIESKERIFANEIQNMIRLKGMSHIASYEDHLIKARADGVYDIFIRMELLQPISVYFAANPANRIAAARLGADICRALECCQLHGILHRDVKCANIFVSPSGDFKLGDFGNSFCTSGGAADFFEKPGTYTYTAPEVYGGDYCEATMDIYSLGIVLYKLLNNGRFPFITKSNPSEYDMRRAVYKRIAGAQMPTPDNAGDELGAIILKAAAYNPRYRYQNAPAMRSELEGYLARAEQYLPPGERQNARSMRLIDFRRPKVHDLYDTLSSQLDPGADARRQIDSGGTDLAVFTPDMTALRAAIRKIEETPINPCLEDDWPTPE